MERIPAIGLKMRLWQAVLPALVLLVVFPVAWADNPQSLIPPNERPEIIFRQYFDAIQRPPLIRLDRVITEADYKIPPSGSSFITIEANPVNTDPAPVDPATAIHIR